MGDSSLLINKGTLFLTANLFSGPINHKVKWRSKNRFLVGKTGSPIDSALVDFEWGVSPCSDDSALLAGNASLLIGRAY